MTKEKLYILGQNLREKRARIGPESGSRRGPHLRPSGRFVLHYAWRARMNRMADWLKQAERDLQVALNSAASGHHEWAAFAAQQCAEKAVKALIQSLHGAVRGHSITEMLRQLPAAVSVPATLLMGAQDLDKVYVTSRYPNGFASGAPGEHFHEKNSQELIGHARAILEFCRSQIH